MEDELADWDRTVEMAWVRFQRELGDHLAALDPGQDVTFALTTPTDDGVAAGPYVRFTVSADGEQVDAETPAEILLDGRGGALDESAAALREAGWELDRRADEPVFTISMSRSRVDQLAHLAVRALRETYGIPHPVFLEGGFLGADDEEAEQPAEAVAEVDGMAMFVPESAGDLDRFVEEILSSILGKRANRDGDGDFPMRYGTVVIFVRPLTRAPIVELISPLVRDVRDRDHALLEVSILNRDAEFISYHLQGTTIVAKVHVPAFPLVANHLVALLSKMAETLDRVDEDLALRVDGRLWLGVPDSAHPSDSGDAQEDTELEGMAPEGTAPDDTEAGDEELDDTDEDDEELPAPLLAMIQLDADSDTAVTPETVATLFDGDLELVLRCLRVAEEQAISWRESMEESLAEGDVEQADACSHEMRAWEKTVSDLRAGLRFIVDHETRHRWPG